MKRKKIAGAFLLTLFILSILWAIYSLWCYRNTYLNSFTMATCPLTSAYEGLWRSLFGFMTPLYVLMALINCFILVILLLGGIHLLCD